MKTPDEIAQEIADLRHIPGNGTSYTNSRNIGDRGFKIAIAEAAIEADRAQRDPNHDGTLHGATIIALQQRLDWAPENAEENQAVFRAIEWIEEEPDEFWDQFAGLMLDDIEGKFR